MAHRYARLILACLLSPAFFLPATMASPPQKPLLVAHRGASGYAPEHTLAAYALAIEQGADFVEQDLQITKDGHFICLHDPDLARTTNVREVFPDRATMRDPDETGNPHRGYYVIDFTLAQIKQLDAGSWFNRANPFAANPDYAGQRVPTLEEAIKLVGKRAGLYIELKHYPFYKQSGFDAAQKLAAILKAHGFDQTGERDRILIQSFSKQCLLRMREVAPAYRRIQLLPMEDAARKEDSAKVTAALAKEIAAYAQGVGPAKAMLKDASDVAVFHAAGLLVHPYTFRGPTIAAARKPLDEMQPNGSTVRQGVIEDILRYAGFGIDGGFTDYPALWREAERKQPNTK
ncbi:MAG TPA: glycerophosphodiester phosphodiesterase family protein [Blastocatellia bacterium]|nr:glycerophosphodiester phosphodiesterase family protein [Blastocatellia bacterium]